MWWNLRGYQSLWVYSAVNFWIMCNVMQQLAIYLRRHSLNIPPRNYSKNRISKLKLKFSASVVPKSNLYLNYIEHLSCYFMKMVLIFNAILWYACNVTAWLDNLPKLQRFLYKTLCLQHQAEFGEIAFYTYF